MFLHNNSNQYVSKNVYTIKKTQNLIIQKTVNFILIGLEMLYEWDMDVVVKDIKEVRTFFYNCFLHFSNYK